jgi:hypothetical protein
LFKKSIKEKMDIALLESVFTWREKQEQLFDDLN